MIKKMTRQTIDSLEESKPSGTKNIVWDPLLPGFGAYKVASGRVSFIYQYRMPGEKTQRILIGYRGEFTIEEARIAAGEYAQQRRKGTDPVAAAKALRSAEAARGELIFSTYAEDYLARRIANGRPHNKAQTSIIRKDVVGFFGEARIDKIGVKDCEKFSSSFGDRGESARRMGIVYAKTIFTDAVKRGVITASPAASIETPQSGQRDRRLRDSEIQRLLEASKDVDGPRGDIYEVIARTLKRKEEVSRLEWQHLDLPRGRWALPAEQSKNSRPYDIQLPRQVIAIIEAQQPDPKLRHGPVFTLDEGATSPEMGSQVKNLLDANMARRLAFANERDGLADKVEHFTIHDIRTTGASRMQEEPLRVPPDVINAVLLHVVGSGVSKIYLRSQLVEGTHPIGAALSA